MSVADFELMRARWRRTLETMALDTTRRPDFGRGSLSQRVAANTARAVILPADPEPGAMRFDDDWWNWLEDHKFVEVGGRTLRLGERAHPTAHAAVLAREYGGDHPWNSYLAVYRSGAVELELGDLGAWEHEDRNGNRIRQFNLISIIAYVWGMASVAERLVERTGVGGPFHLTVALVNTGGAVLGNVAEGWAEPHSFENRVGGCADEHLLWHWELAELPAGDDLRELALSVGDRLEDAWGVRQRRYLAHRGELQGSFDHRRVAE
jgi:hypothetical protein